MVEWHRIQEDECPSFGKRSFTFSFGGEIYEVSIDEAKPSELFFKYRGKSWVWSIERIEKRGDQFLISGLADFEDTFFPEAAWFEFHCYGKPKIIYWGDQVILRVDQTL